MSTDQKSRTKRSSLRTHGINLSALVLSLSICVLMLSGCATKSIVISPDCPRPIEKVPQALTKPKFSHALDYSKRVQNYLKKVEEWLKNSQ